MTLHSGARYGIPRTLPLILGIQFGFAVMLGIIAFGSAAILSQVENAANALRIICFVYLLYLAWRIASGPAPDLDSPVQVNSRPIGALEAALFQWINPKAWAVAIAAVGTYSFLFTGTAYTVLGFSGTFLLVGLPSSFLWAAGGKLIGGILKSQTQYRAFSVITALLMIAAVIPALLSF